MDTVRVLLADDNHGMLKILEEYFRSKGDVEVVGSVSDGAQVMAAICQHSPDVLLLDIILPRRDGFSILADMRALAPEARPKVIVLTGLSRDDFVAQAWASCTSESSPWRGRIRWKPRARTARPKKPKWATKWPTSSSCWAFPRTSRAINTCAKA